MIEDIDETGVAVKFHGQTFKVAGYWERRKVEPKNAGRVEWEPARGGPEEMQVWPPPALGKRGGGDASKIEGH